MNKVYVKLKDAGTIFSDNSQSENITGALPKEMKLTKKVQDAIRLGTLVEVEASEAKAEIAAADKTAKKAATDSNNKESVALRALKADNAKLKKEVSELSEANLDLEDKLEKKETYIKGLQTQITNLKAGKTDEDTGAGADSGAGAGDTKAPAADAKGELAAKAADAK